MQKYKFVIFLIFSRKKISEIFEKNNLKIPKIVICYDSLIALYNTHPVVSVNTTSTYRTSFTKGIIDIALFALCGIHAL